MRFTTKAEEFEVLKADTLDKLAKYMEAVKNATYEDLQDQHKSIPLVKTYTDVVESNAAFRAFLNKNKLYTLMKSNII
jgi:hypothetical protein